MLKEELEPWSYGKSEFKSWLLEKAKGMQIDSLIEALDVDGMELLSNTVIAPDSTPQIMEVRRFCLVSILSRCLPAIVPSSLRPICPSLYRNAVCEVPNPRQKRS